MTLTVLIGSLGEEARPHVGAKAFALARMAQAGLAVPPALVVTAQAYRRYLHDSGLGERVLLELNRKRFEDLRWEELWDAALRIRGMFLNTSLPLAMREQLLDEGLGEWGDRPVAIRSSALDEDASESSFAGLHESYVNVRGLESILDHVRLVWASLWSDAALLYRQELGLDVSTSAMAVLVQQLVAGERSGVAFCVDPTNDAQALVEAVYGLNQGLVDGTVEPDRWVLDRNTGAVLAHHGVERREVMRPSPSGAALVPLAQDLAQKPPLSDVEAQAVFALAKRCEALFGSAQDVEWTYAQNGLFVLQSRPITAGGGGDGSQRSWYLSLRRSYDNLRSLRVRIEDELIPAMVAEAKTLAEADLGSLGDAEFAAELEKRVTSRDRWTRVYWDEFIPFAHGARLFGQVYNDVMRPEDPFEFVSLLGGNELASVKRHSMVAELARQLREDADLAARAATGTDDLPVAFRQGLDELVRQLGALGGEGASAVTYAAVMRLLMQAAAADAPPPRVAPSTGPALEREFLAHFPDDQRTQAADLLDLARASYKLRDDDNIYLGQREAEVTRAAVEARRRLQERRPDLPTGLTAEQAVLALRDPAYEPPVVETKPVPQSQWLSKARQLTGQPAGPGLATGVARVILEPAGLFDFKSGEVLVCDAIDPNMTFVVPLATAIIERRGGMLIHGAIIAREYGLPCVTGVPQATQLIKTGDTVTVDGYLGIVVVRRDDAAG
jgi:pyruvate,water dikinase